MTVDEISRKACRRCGSRPGYSTWQVCADGNRVRVLCQRCDIALNKLVLRWAKDPKAEQKLKAYKRKLAR